MYIFEALMLVCFGVAWPFSVYKSYTSRSNEGKSVLFLYAAILGYVFGIIYQIFGVGAEGHWVLYVFAVNFIMILADLFLYYRNKKQLIINN